MTVASSHLLSVVNTSPRLSKLSNIFVTSSSKIINLDVFSSMGGISQAIQAFTFGWLWYDHTRNYNSCRCIRVAPSGKELGGSPHYPKNWLDALPSSTVCPQNSWFCKFHADFGHFVQIVPHQSTPFGKPCIVKTMFLVD